MADSKITALTALTTASTDDLLYIVDDPGGSPTSKKITVDNFQKSITKVGKVSVTQPATSATIAVADGKTLTVSNDATVSGTNTGDQTITLTGNVTGSGTGSFATTIANGVVTEAMQVLADNTTNDFSTTKHGYVPKGTNLGKFLKDDGTWSSPIDKSCRVYQTGTTALTTSWVSCAFAAENFDTDTMHDNASNNTRITFTTAGKYIVGGGIVVSNNTVMGARIRLGGSTVIAQQKQGNGGSPEGANVCTIYDFSAADYIELQGYASTFNSSGDALTNFWAYKLN